VEPALFEKCVSWYAREFRALLNDFYLLDVGRVPSAKISCRLINLNYSFSAEVVINDALTNIHFAWLHVSAVHPEASDAVYVSAALRCDISHQWI
jgi:hypothetical protein